jgi:hypothetical protein
VTSYILKHILAKDSETAILEYKIDMYLNSIKKEIIANYIEAGKGHKEHMGHMGHKEHKEHMGHKEHKEHKEHMGILTRQAAPEPIGEIVDGSPGPEVPTVTPYSTFFNTYYLIDSPEESFGLKTTQFLK